MVVTAIVRESALDLSAPSDSLGEVIGGRAEYPVDVRGCLAITTTYAPTPVVVQLPGPRW
jgi:hypothetical protein